MKKIVIYTLISFIFSVFASSCEDNKDNSLYYPDFMWDTGDGEEDEDPVTETSMRVATYNLHSNIHIDYLHILCFRQQL